MSKRIIQTELAPAAIGPYSQAIRIGDFLYTSGQIALDPKSGKFLSGEIKEETEQTLRNISAILQADGLELVAALPKGAKIEIDAIASCSS